MLRSRLNLKVNVLNDLVLVGCVEHFCRMNKNKHTSNRDMSLHALPWAPKGHLFLTYMGVLVLHIVHRNAAY